MKPIEKLSNETLDQIKSQADTTAKSSASAVAVVSLGAFGGSISGAAAMLVLGLAELIKY